MAVFNPVAFNNSLGVSVIGCGATGSRVALSLATLGINDIKLWDDDVVAEHNLANQVFNHAQVGMPKAKALADIMEAVTGDRPAYKIEKADGRDRFRGVVFLLTDTMASRKEVFEEALKYKPGVNLVIETRMGADEFRIYIIDPSVPAHNMLYEETLYSDEESSESLCGSQVTVGPTAEIISGMAVWQMLYWLKNDRQIVTNEIIMGLNPVSMMPLLTSFNPPAQAQAA
jgi:molybdopterin/thiamine biosynthesis adenylyltransferase